MIQVTKARERGGMEQLLQVFWTVSTDFQGQLRKEKGSWWRGQAKHGRNWQVTKKTKLLRKTFIALWVWQWYDTHFAELDTFCHFRLVSFSCHCNSTISYMIDGELPVECFYFALKRLCISGKLSSIKELLQKSEEVGFNGQTICQPCNEPLSPATV